MMDEFTFSLCHTLWFKSRLYKLNRRIRIIIRCESCDAGDVYFGLGQSQHNNWSLRFIRFIRHRSLKQPKKQKQTKANGDSEGTVGVQWEVRTIVSFEQWLPFSKPAGSLWCPMNATLLYYYIIKNLRSTPSPRLYVIFSQSPASSSWTRVPFLYYYMALLPFNISYLVFTPRRVRLPGEPPSQPTLAAPEKEPQYVWIIKLVYLPPESGRLFKNFTTLLYFFLSRIRKTIRWSPADISSKAKSLRAKLSSPWAGSATMASSIKSA